ncbi:hypothetical protein CLHUN_08420 [Ruminiclostridium hungatei]|uniref:HEAT repeat protein n=1 Tax=Ruminiclostridium hungatei TaxID=48256 RepID=A0A1V4SNM3_RUMHU|nr:hypothetical protein [Ruminiclostridium hungatei]OPX45472.1 hypothetical protein CLHUN_08420 [Ruminiclostridium hungatei]
MAKNAVLAQSYNEAIEDGFNKYLEQHATTENSEIKVDEEKLIADIENRWLDTPLEQLHMQTPSDYINSIATLDLLLDLFIEVASISDVGVPDILIEKLKQYGKQAADRLFDFVRDWLKNREQETVAAVSQAVYAIGCLKYQEYGPKLVELLLECFTDDLVTEAICAAIVEYQGDILEELMKTFHATRQAEVQEHILVCVAEISREKQSDEIFYFLKHAFRVISNLKLAVEILGDYGDGRAIPLLRGYVLKNIKAMDRSALNHMRAVIKKLGGDIDDLVLNS